ncbi:MAG: tyrosine--tRNA ligase [SAR202 cluster bacterium]|nr:tyrosine--tRNA ligase [SAR202 cluster bacterium]|tara:strand:+ start:44741 stop:46027 length:1287 start_codon:yes stop_codon:yes gene_type:complete
MTKSENIITPKSFLERGVAEVIVKKEFQKLLENTKQAPLRLKMGFDPSAPDLHLGHAVGLRKLRQLQDMGHKVIVIVGDWTAQIGDPSGKSATRPMLTKEQVESNAKTYLSQFFKIVNKDQTEVRLQSDWFGKFTLADVIKLTSKFTVAQFLARDDFAKRFRENQPIAITELLYPLLQAYDSIEINSDIEFGGTDQKFNLLVGRELQGIMGYRQQQCLLVPILPGTDGVKKMSKSLNNHIALSETPTEMFTKIMRIPDFAKEHKDTNREIHNDSIYIDGQKSMIILYLELLTDTPQKDLMEINQAIKSHSVNPIEIKKLLAKKIITEIHDKNQAIIAEKNFQNIVQHRVIPDDIKIYNLSNLPNIKSISLQKFLVEIKLANSSSEAKRLITQNAVKLNEATLDSSFKPSTIKSGNIIRVGRKLIMKFR